MAETTSFAAWLKRRRKALDLTREALAKRAHCSASTIRRLEADDLRASTQLAESLAAALDIPSEQRNDFVRFVRGDPSAFVLRRVTEPPPPEQATPPYNLPAPLTSFVGRQREVAAIGELLTEPGVRLLTLSGPPGIGKTRLSIAVAQQFCAAGSVFVDGVYFVPLAPIEDARLVASVLAQVLDVRENSSAAGALEAVRRWLRDKHVLLVFDNFEQVLDAAPLVTELLANAPHVKVLITSRAVLHLYGEHEFPVAALSLPDVGHLPTTKALAYLGRFAALQLFQDRARAAALDFHLTADNVAEVARICAWLDGLPLAIEMAAAQVKWQPVSQVLEQLGNQLMALTGGPIDLSPRQQSLTGAIEWSYRLLSADECRVFEALGVFVGGADEAAIHATLQGLTQRPDEAAYAVSVASLLRALVEKNLLRYEVTPNGPPRYSMLEMIRAFARDKLTASDQLEAARAAHARHFGQLALAAQRQLIRGSDQAQWLNRLEIDHNNYRAALAWSLEDRSRAGFALLWAEALYYFWNVRGYLSEGRRWLEAALALPEPGDLSTDARSRALNCAGQLAQVQGDYATAQAWHTEARAIQEARHDAPGLCCSLENLAILAANQGDYAQADEMFEQSLVVRRTRNDWAALLPTLNNLAIVKRRLGHYPRAIDLYRESAETARAAKADKSLAHALHGLAEVHVMQDQYEAALPLFRESLSLRRQLGNHQGISNTLATMAVVYLRLDEALTAAKLIAASECLRLKIGMFMPPVGRRELDDTIAQVRDRAGADFDVAWSAGQAMSEDEAIDLALGAASERR